MNANSIMSIYIPSMLNKYTESKIKQIMTELCIGHVSDIDFTPVNNDVKSAYIYFRDTSSYKNGFARAPNDEGIEGNFDFWQTIVNDLSCKIRISETEEWECFINNKPIQRTMMNIHQVVENENVRYLELEKKISELEEKLATLIKIHIENMTQEHNKKISELEEKLATLIK